MNTMRMRDGFRRIESDWPQTVQLQRTHRTRRRPQRQRPPIQWGLCLMLAGATFLTVLALAYRLTTP